MFQTAAGAAREAFFGTGTASDGNPDCEHEAALDPFEEFHDLSWAELQQQILVHSSARRITSLSMYGDPPQYSVVWAARKVGET